MNLKTNFLLSLRKKKNIFSSQKKKKKKYIFFTTRINAKIREKRNKNEFSKNNKTK